jgi:hypothetical protein
MVTAENEVQFLSRLDNDRIWDLGEVYTMDVMIDEHFIILKTSPLVGLWYETKVDWQDRCDFKVEEVRLYGHDRMVLNHESIVS